MNTPCVHEGAAVYQIRAVVGGRPRRLARFLDKDASGILCIGMTVNLRSRVRAFNRGLQVGRGHSEANLFRRLAMSAKMRGVLRRWILEYRYQPVRDRKAAQQLEGHLIRGYVKRYGEVPPLNSAIPDRYAPDGW